MNKKLVALAVAGALALPLAAQAQTANVTLYGSLRLGVANVRATNSTAGVASVAVTRVDSNSSRFGLKGEEDLGGGIKAIFLIESGFDASSNGNNSVNNGAGAASASGLSSGSGASDSRGGRDAGGAGLMTPGGCGTCTAGRPIIVPVVDLALRMTRPFDHKSSV